MSSTVSRPPTQQRKVSRRRRAIRRFAALIAVAFVSATVFEGVVLWTHKAFAAPWTSCGGVRGGVGGHAVEVPTTVSGIVAE